MMASISRLRLLDARGLCCVHSLGLLGPLLGHGSAPLRGLRTLLLGSRARFPRTNRLALRWAADPPCRLRAALPALHGAAHAAAGTHRARPHEPGWRWSGGGTQARNDQRALQPLLTYRDRCILTLTRSHVRVLQPLLTASVAASLHSLTLQHVRVATATASCSCGCFVPDHWASCFAHLTSLHTAA